MTDRVDPFPHPGRPPLELLALVCMGVYLFVLNLPGVVTIREASLFTAVVLAAVSAARRRRWSRPPMAAWLGAWLAVAVISVAAAGDPGHAVSEIKKDIVYPVLAFWLFYVMVRDEGDYYILSLFILAGASLLAVSSLYAYFVTGLRFEELTGPGILYGNRENFSFFMLAAALVCMALAMTRGVWWPVRAYATVLAPLCVIGVYFARLRAGYLAVCLAVCLVLVYTNVAGRSLGRKAVVLLCLLVVAVPLPAIMAKRDLDFTLDPDMIKVSIDRLGKEERWTIWKESVDRISERPLLGRGFGEKELFIPGFRVERVYPHNLFLSYGMMTGVAGAGVVLIIFGRLFLILNGRVPGFRPGPRSCYNITLAGLAILLVFAVLNMTEDIMTRHSAQLFWALMGMTLGACRALPPEDPGG